MLLQLTIKNYAIIDEIIIDFREGLQVITGETGAGKSIIAGALSLVLGERADTSILKFRDRKSVVEAIFQVSHLKDIENIIADEELEVQQELILRREININGKSRAFVNDSPVNLEQLRRICFLLVDMHQQFDILSLGQSDFQLAVVDVLASNSNLLTQYHSLFQQLQNSKRQLEELKLRQTRADKENDYHSFLFAELDEADLKENEFEETEIFLKRLNHAEAIKKALTGIYFNFSLSEHPVVQEIKMSSQLLEPFKAYHKDFPEILKRLASVQIELQDIADEIESMNEEIQFDDEQIEKLNERIHLGYKLLKKHGVASTADLIVIREQLRNRIRESLNIAEEINNKEKLVGLQIKEISIVAHKLSSNRNAEISGLEAKVNELLKKVGMPNARIRVSSSITDLKDTGIDNIEFLFDANKNDRFESLKKVASGGELSRLMLCIKSLVAQSMDMPTLLFDEIDSGISGEAARQVGIILKDLSRSRQVICITHQPQIAAKGDTHFFVYKEMKGETINTKIRVLNNEERIISIAKMISGEKPTAAAIENARELVN
jgi:DNA repair protein RecN (Recombination protein N)